VERQTPGSYRLFERDGRRVLYVRSIGRDLWFVQRAIYNVGTGAYEKFQELTHTRRPRIILTRGSQAAMCLAKRFNASLSPLGVPEVAWSPSYEYGNNLLGNDTGHTVQWCHAVMV